MSRYLMTAIVVAAAVILIPICVTTSGRDYFRLPKEILFRGFGLCLLLLFAWSPSRWFNNFRTDLKTIEGRLALAILLWSFFTFVLSQNLVISAYSLGWIVSAWMCFFAARTTANVLRVETWMIILAVPVLLNAIVLIFQVTQIWNPFVPEGALLRRDEAQWHTALLGNPNDAGTFLTIPALLFASYAVVNRQFRLPAGAMAGLAAVAIVLTGTVTAILATVAGLTTLMLVILVTDIRRLKLLVVTGGTCVLLAGLTFAATAGSSRLDRVLSGRLVAFHAAALLGSEHPLTGNGPGTFAWQYFDGKLEAERRNPELLDSTNRRINFGEAHNDYLETFAEAGIPGVILLLVAIATLGSYTFRPHADQHTAGRRIARLFALPGAVSFSLLAAAQFPLQIAATMVTLTVISGLVSRWNYDAA